MSTAQHSNIKTTLKKFRANKCKSIAECGQQLITAGNSQKQAT